LETKNIPFNDIKTYYLTAYHEQRGLLALCVEVKEDKYIKLMDTLIDNGFELHKISKAAWYNFHHNIEEKVAKSYYINEKDFSEFFKWI